VSRLLRLLGRFEEAFLALLLGAMVLLAVLQIVLRNGFDAGISWGDDAVRMLVFWVAMVGSMVAARRGQHIRIDALVRYLPPGVRSGADRAIDGVAALLCVVVAWFCFEFAAGEYGAGQRAFASVPSWVAVSVMPFAFLVIGVRYALHAALGRPPLVERPVSDAVEGQGSRAA
jgi:TRAP-type C4-dicarboxylate transport system permease small subunit